MPVSSKLISGDRGDIFCPETLHAWLRVADGNQAAAVDSAECMGVGVRADAVGRDEVELRECIVHAEVRSSPETRSPDSNNNTSPT
jgi:hypothetical protein